jgi:hypothetical protein
LLSSVVPSRQCLGSDTQSGWHDANQRRVSSGSFATFAAIRRAS